jgi:hypothetical protein
VSGRPTREQRGAILQAPAVADGGKHPGLPEHISLRGAVWERIPRLVRRVVWGSSPSGRRTGDKGCSKVAEEGNVCQPAPCVGNPAQGLASSCSRDTSFTRSFNPYTSTTTLLHEVKSLLKVAHRKTYQHLTISRKWEKMGAGASSVGRHGSQRRHRLSERRVCVTR